MSAGVVVIAAGGTGGHVFPGLAVADALVAQGGGRPVFVGTRKGMETRLVTDAGHALELFDVVPIKGGGAPQALMGVFHAAKALASARRFLRETSPRAVISIGGYAAGPVSLAAAALGVPVVLVEPNSVMGLSNRLLAPLAARIYLAFVEARPRMSGSRARVTGVPLRVGFDARPTGAPTGVRRVLVLGGSQGAQALNERVPDALGRVASELGATTTLQVLHQSGEGKDSAVVEAYARAGLRDARVVAFSTSLPEDLAWADLVIGRAGAGTIAEIAAVGRASVLVPLPSAADDHQAKNAAAYARTGAALWLRQESADATRLAAEISRILRDDARRATMARAARDEGRPEAARTIARDLLQLIEVS